jgi:hypothetical protein
VELKSFIFFFPQKVLGARRDRSGMGINFQGWAKRIYIRTASQANKLHFIPAPYFGDRITSP